jgi:hypothetical protein
MGRTKGTPNKQVHTPEIVTLGNSEKLEILADILLDIVIQEGKGATTNR